MTLFTIQIASTLSLANILQRSNSTEEKHEKFDWLNKKTQIVMC